MYLTDILLGRYEKVAGEKITELVSRSNIEKLKRLSDRLDTTPPIRAGCPDCALEPVVQRLSDSVKRLEALCRKMEKRLNDE